MMHKIMQINLCQINLFLAIVLYIYIRILTSTITRIMYIDATDFLPGVGVKKKLASKTPFPGQKN